MSLKRSFADADGPVPALTRRNANVSFGSTRDSPREITLRGVGKSSQSVAPRSVDLRPIDQGRRDFLVRFCQGAGAILVPANLWSFAVPASTSFPSGGGAPVPAEFPLKPHYRSERPLDATLLKVQAGLDEFVTEKYADQIAAILAAWSTSLLQSPRETQAIEKAFAADFLGVSPKPTNSRVVPSSSALQVRQNKFTNQPALNGDGFLREWQSALSAFSRIVTAEFQIVGIDAGAETPSSHLPVRLQTRIRYEIVGTGLGFYREQRVGTWELIWEPSSSIEFRVRGWRVLDETQARSSSPIYVDVASAALGSNASYPAQMMHGTDYWRTVLDGACGIDIYGHNGVSVADIDNDGFDDFYVCQPAGLPNLLYRNRGDGTFEDITESSGLGILENTACALFADFSNHGHQDVIVVRANGPLLFVNQGGGKFRQEPNAFRFATPPQGTFTGAAAADYDRDGWLDVYFCVYA
jgi:hypothetical protein